LQPMRDFVRFTPYFRHLSQCLYKLYYNNPG
jgi:hypothetical protein